ncbi:MAG: hypothetical protein AAGE61_20150, partial [Pseudomonadota bacterium]
LGITPPPIPDIYKDSLQEVEMDCLFATDPSLVELRTPDDIAEMVAKEWPPVGLAFGFLTRGVTGIWFYTLVSEQIILNVCLRYQSLPTSAAQASAGIINMAHSDLERYFSNETNYFRAVTTVPSFESAPRDIISYYEDLGVASELHARWTSDEKTCVFTEKNKVFSDILEGLPHEEMVMRV